MTIPLTSKALQISQQEIAAESIVNEILDENMESLMNQYMIPEVKRVAQSANVPEGFILGIEFIRTGSNEGDIINTWGSLDTPLALWFNYGTADHGSKGNWPLRWKSKTTGEMIYAQFVRGVPKTLAMEIGMMLGIERLKEVVPKIIEDVLEA